MTYYIRHLFCVAAALSSVAVQAIELNSNFNLDLTPTLVSDYRSMGVSQTQGNPALQLSGVLTHSSGLFLGLWASNVDFGTKARLEEGYYAGYSHAFTEAINISASIGRYEYPGEASLDTNEIYAEANIHQLKIGYIYDYGVANHVPDLSSRFIGYTFNLPYDTNLYIKYGHTDYGFDMYSGNGSTRQTYSDWEVKLSKAFYGVTFSADFIDTDMSKHECMSVMAVDDVCSATLVIAATKTF
ncbi:TorF family putative porin [Pantoea sp. Ap-967]|uniref:TorF family putative porin n=1 Tax=Pantoea sp. Ap-967 TaxID=2608362 RepID=UPI001421086D|nr:TorF family putative porin [Pantoea sp. Ap-967]